MADIIFTANVGADGELRFTKEQRPVLNFRACESKSRRLDDGSYEKLREQWFDVALFGPAGEALAADIRKGTRVKVAGEVWRRDYEGRNGSGVALDVNATGVQILPTRNGQQGANRDSGFGTAGTASAGGQGQVGGGWNGQPANPDPWGGNNDAAGWGQ